LYGMNVNLKKGVNMITEREKVKQFSKCTGLYCWDCRYFNVENVFCDGALDCYVEYKRLYCSKRIWTLEDAENALDVAVALTSATACQMLTGSNEVNRRALAAGWVKIDVFRQREPGAPFVQYDTLLQPPETVIRVGQKIEYTDYHGGTYEVIEVGISGQSIKIVKIG